MRDPYKVLGVPRNADAEAIKQSYRQLARQFHPDLDPGNPKAEERFKEVGAAYQILSDPDQRARFDRGEIGADGQPRGRPRPASGRPRSAANPFNRFFRAKAPEAAAGLKVDGANLSYALTVPFIDAAVGTTSRIRLAGGRTVDVRVPAGTTEGQVLRLKGQGLTGIGGGEAGDALVTVSVAADAVFRRDGFDVHSTLSVTLPEALAGCRVEVPTVHGPVTLDIPPSANTDTILRLKGKGIDRADGTRGDQLVTLKVILPRDRDDELRSFIENWGRKHPYTVKRHPGDAG